jgi:endonuclease/exonuclease/phosphatase family metal-dependent hydrolase
MYKTMLTSAFAALSLCACSGDDPTGPSPSEARGQTTPPIVVMTRNMYIGADVDRVIAALSGLSGENPAVALGNAMTQLYITDLPTRIGAIANEIAANRPLVVALQEVSEYSIDLRPIGGPGPVTGDFLSGLQAALMLKGLDYDVVSNLNFNFTGIGGLPINLKDSDVLLVDSRLEVLATSHGTYPCPGLCIPVDNLGNLTRGWARADIRIAGRTVTFVGTHPEAGDTDPIPLLRAGQIQTLVASLPANNPVVLMGDLNGIPGSPVYQVLQAAGFVDAWESSGDAGNTCCFDPALQTGSLVKRIDYIMVRGGFLNPAGRVVGGARLVGATMGDKVLGQAGPIWPSDHAGIVAIFPPAR